MEEARALPPETLLQLVRLAETKYRRRLKIFTVLGLGLYFIVMLLVPSMLEPFHLAQGFVRLTQIAVLLIYGICLNASLMKQARRNLAVLLQESQDKRLVPSFLTLIKTKDGTIDKQIAQPLKRLLPELSKTDVREWTPKQKKALLDVLTEPFKDVELTLGVLKALERTGDESALAPVRGVAQMAVISLALKKRTNGRQKGWRMQQAAQECLAALEARIESEGRMLLRASDASGLPLENTLVRPAEAGPDSVPAEELLRVPDAALPAQGTEERRWIEAPQPDAGAAQVKVSEGKE